MIQPPFYVSEEIPPGLTELLDKITLGTNGARYRQNNVEETLSLLDNPIHFYLRRHQGILANVTLCQRPNAGYVRYFAFDPKFHSQKAKSKENSALTAEINKFFDHWSENSESDLIYAYIDPDNQKSINFAEKVGFERTNQVVTQTFSRLNPKPKLEIIKADFEELKTVIRTHFSEKDLYFENQLKRGEFYVYQQNNQPIGFCQIHKANWTWDSLPGRFGQIKAKILRHTPYLKRLLYPPKHEFCVFDTVYWSTNIQLLDGFFESILHDQKVNSALWWVSEKDSTYRAAKNTVSWGILNRLTGTKYVNFMTRGRKVKDNFYISGLDLI